MRLNPLYPSDNPMEEFLFCFGGGDDGGSGGGGSNASGDPSEESTVDFGGGPGVDDGDTGDTGDSSNVGGSPDDQDSMDSGYDTSTVGMGTNTMGFGGGPAGDGPGFYADPFGAPTYPDVSNLGAKPTRADIAARAGVSPDTIVGSGPGGRNPVMGGGNPVKSGSAVAAEAERLGVSVDEINSRINEASKAASNAASIGAASDIAVSEFDELGLDVPEFDEPAGAVSMYGIPGVTPPGSYAATPVTQTVRGPALGTTDYEAGAYGVVGGGIAARGPGLSYDPGLIAEPEFVQPGGPGTRGLALAVGDQAKRGVDAAQDYMDSLQAANRERIASGGTRDVSTTIDPMDMLDPFGDGFMTDEQRAASDAELQAIDNRINAIRGATPVEQITRQATGPGQTVSSAEIQNKIASAGSAGTRPSTVQGQSVLSVGLGPNKQEFTFDNTVPSDQRTYTQVSGPSLEVSQDLGAGTAAPGTSYTGVGSLNYSPAPTPDPVGASIDRAIADFAGYREGQTRTQTPDGVVVDDFMLTRDLVSKPTEYGAAYSPLEQLRMQEGTRTVPAINVPDIDVFGVQIPTSIAGRVISDVLTPASALDRALQDPDTRAIYDAQGRIEGAVDKYGVVYDATPYDFESSEAMKQAYAEQNRRQEAERGGGGDGGQATTAPAQEVVPEPPPEDYRGRDIVSGYQYQPRGPISYAYTGLPSLAPQVLRPSFQARGQYAPLFPMGNLRRS